MPKLNLSDVTAWITDSLMTLDPPPDLPSVEEAVEEPGWPPRVSVRFDDGRAVSLTVEQIT